MTKFQIKIVTILVMILLLCLSRPVFAQGYAQSYNATTFSAVQIEGGIEIYKIENNGSFVLLTVLENFYLGEVVNSTSQWLIPYSNYVTNSFNGKYIAFTAIRGSNRALFVYNLDNSDLTQVSISSLAIPVWSPDSHSILLSLTESPKDAYLYQLDQNSLLRIGIAGDLRWLSDSSGFVYIGDSSSCQNECPAALADLYIMDRFGNNPTPLTDLASEIGTENPITICDPTWSSINRRIYYIVGCSGGGDNFPKYIYSTDFNSDNRQEVDLTTLFPDESYIRVMGIYPDIDGIYISMRSEGGTLRFMRLDYSNNIEEIYEYGFAGQSLSATSMSLNRGFIAFSNEGYDRVGYLRMFDLYANDIIQESTFTQSIVCELTWLNDTTLMYSVVTGGYCDNVTASSSHTYEIYNAETDTVTQLPQSTGDATWIIRPTYLSSPIPLILTESDASTTVTESGAIDTYTLALGTQPTADVVVNITGTDQVTVSPATLTFTPENWDTPQTVTVTAVDDAVVEGHHTAVITHSAVSADAGYHGVSMVSVKVNIDDNDAQP